MAHKDKITKRNKTVVDEAWREVKESTLNKCWSKLLPEVVQVSEPEETYEECVKSLLRLATEIGGEGFEDVREAEIYELIQAQNEEFSAEDIDQILRQSETKEEMKDEEESPEPVFTLTSITKIILLVQDAIDEAYSTDPIMTRSLKFKHDCELALKSYEELRKDMTRRAKQARVTDYFKQL